MGTTRRLGVAGGLYGLYWYLIATACTKKRVRQRAQEQGSTVLTLAMLLQIRGAGALFYSKAGVLLAAWVSLVVAAHVPSHMLSPV